jgi:hypothetical protein
VTQARAGQSRHDVQGGEVRRSALYIRNPYKAETHRNGGYARAMRRSAFHTVRVRQLRGGCPGLCGGQNKSEAILRGCYGELPVRGGSERSSRIGGKAEVWGMRPH